jgi:hypothetical protein
MIRSIVFNVCSRSKLPLKSVVVLRKFFVLHINHPFPSDAEKSDLANECNLQFKQVSDWLVNHG